MAVVPQPDTLSLEFPVVGIGACAGGITALQTLSRSIPTAPELGFVVVQHPVPDHPSQLARLFASWTKLPVREATEGSSAVAHGALPVWRATARRTCLRARASSRQITCPRIRADLINCPISTQSLRPISIVFRTT
jgi:chemotaxis response regulator CheB